MALDSDLKTLSMNLQAAAGALEKVATTVGQYALLFPTTTTDQVAEVRTAVNRVGAAVTQAANLLAALKNLPTS